ncbi:alpha/beta fold hydrolase [Bdellovibrio sp. HCB337]|uniref:alpha/beta fold hydrolase n=1 Tax=Bdellovibrio sp. HCB337 TaxID=3394358 RepID=UPI0039A4DA0D
MAHKITFRERGQGPILILLHGFGGSVHHWESCAEELSKHYRVVVPNLSHLFMSTDRIFFTVQVETIAHFIRSNFPGQKVHIAGLSFGAALTWALSRQHPGLIEKIILINPVVTDPISNFTLPELRYFFVMPMSSRAIYVLLSTPIGKSFLKRAAMIFRDERSGGVGRLDALQGRRLLFVSHLIYNFAWMLRREDWSYWKDKLSLTNFPCLMIFDREDLLFTKDVYLKFAQELKAEKVVELTGAGHLAIKSRPETISKAIHEYLSNVVEKAA